MIAQTFAGCDISKTHLDLCLIEADQMRLHRRFTNDPKGITACVETLIAHEVVLTVYEPSGGYERCFAQALRARHCAGRRMNARQIRDFAKSLGLLAKTDRIDAQILAHYAAKIRPDARVPAYGTVSQLQAFVRRRAQLVEARKKEKQHLATCPHDEIRAEIEEEIKHLSDKITAANETIKQLIKADEDLTHRAEIIGSVAGLGPVSIATLLSEVPELGRITGKAAANLIGVAPHPRDSGTFRGRRCCWGGRKVVRDVLYMASLSACRKVERWRALYDRLRKAGKPHKLATIAVIRHIIETLNAMLRDGKMFKQTHSC